MPVSKLHRDTLQILYNFVNYADVEVNVRPDWLLSPNGTRLELDIYLPKFQLAIEIQGAQHYEFIPHFHSTEEAFKYQQACDATKQMLCDHHGIKLFEIASVDDLSAVIDHVAGHLVQQWARKEPSETGNVELTEDEIKIVWSAANIAQRLPNSWKTARQAKMPVDQMARWILKKSKQNLAQIIVQRLHSADLGRLLQSGYRSELLRAMERIEAFRQICAECSIAI